MVPKYSSPSGFLQAEELNIKQITNNPRDEVFMKELVELIMANLTKEDFGVTEITHGMLHHTVYTDHQDEGSQNPFTEWHECFRSLIRCRYIRPELLYKMFQKGI